MNAIAVAVAQGTKQDRVLNLIKCGLTVPEIIRAAPTTHHNPLFGRGYVTGAALTRMVLAGLQKRQRDDGHECSA